MWVAPCLIHTGAAAYNTRSVNNTPVVKGLQRLRTVTWLYHTCAAWTLSGSMEINNIYEYNRD